MSKREQKLIDIAKRFRKLKYKINNFYQYQLMVNYKHLLIIGDTHSSLGQEVIKTFGESWQIANISSKMNEKCNFNLELNFNDINKTPFTKEQIEEIDQKVKEFSKHYECILYLPTETQQQQNETQSNQFSDIKDESIFIECEKEKSNNVEPAILASYLATKYLITNGTLMYLGDYPSFSEPQKNRIAQSLAHNQVNLLNLSLGDREFIEVDSYSLCLLQNEKLNDNEAEIKSTQQIAKYIKLWADGKQRPISGTFIKFSSKDGFLYPELF